MRWALASLALAACAHAPPALDFSIGPEGAAGLSVRTAGTLEAVARDAPGYEIAEDETVSGERRFRRITLSLEGEVIFNAYPAPDASRLTGIGTRSARARGANGDTIGRSTFGEGAGFDRENCRLAQPHERFSFSCPDASGQFWRAYQTDAGYTAAGAKFADIPGDIAQSALLVQMYWVAPSGAE